MRRPGCLVALAVAALLLVLGWALRDDLRSLFLGSGRAATEVSEEAAVIAEAKVQRVREHGETVELSEIEIASLVRYRWGGWLPGGLAEPWVALRGDTLYLGGQVPADAIPEVPELARVRFLLPDTVPVEVGGRLAPLSDGRAAFEILTLEVSQVPVPSRYHDNLAERLGRRDDASLPPTAIPLPLPDGVGSAEVRGGVLILGP
jgi:hypothetical protein